MEHHVIPQNIICLLVEWKLQIFQELFGLLLEVHVDVLYIYFKDESLGITGGFTVNNLRLYICILVLSVVWTGQDFFFQSLVFMLQLMLVLYLKVRTWKLSS